MGCIEQLDYELIAKGITITEYEKYIRNNCDEIFSVDSGYKIFGDIFLFGSTKILIGIYNDKIILPFIKPVLASFLLNWMAVMKFTVYGMARIHLIMILV